MTNEEINIVNYETTEYLKKTIPNFEKLTEEQQALCKLFLLISITYKIIKSYENFTTKQN